MSILAVTQNLLVWRSIFYRFMVTFQIRQLQRKGPFSGKILTSLNVTAYLSLIVTTYVFSNKK